MSGVKRRKYDATRRREQARRTRLDIIEAARRLFVERGYAATRMTDVAGAAGVAVETLYAGFRSKANLLKTTFDVTIAGDDEPVPVADRPAIQAIRAEPDPARALALYATFVATTAPRAYPLALIVLAAARSDASVRELADELSAQRLAGMTAFAHQLADTGQLVVSVDEARDLLWTLNSPQVYDLLVQQRGWSHKDFETFLARTWVQGLLGHG